MRILLADHNGNVLEEVTPLVQSVSEVLNGVGRARLPIIPGVVPGEWDRPQGCLFNPRCRYADERCRRETPQLEGREQELVRCHRPLASR